MAAFKDVFISYAHDIQDFTDDIERRLKQSGYTVWKDRSDIRQGTYFQEEINRGIEQSHNFLFVINPKSIKSIYCHREVEWAVKYSKRIIPVVYEQPAREDEEAYMPQVIREINWIIFQNRNHDKAFADLKTLLEEEKEYKHRHTALLHRALKWANNNRPTSLLLDGDERLKAEEWLSRMFVSAKSPYAPSSLHAEYIIESKKNAHNLMTDVFLCTSSADKDLTERLNAALMRNVITTWQHSTDIRSGADYDKAAQRGIEQADNVIFLVSERSLTSDRCKREISIARRLNKRLIILMAEAIPKHQQPDFLRDRKYLDLTDPDRFNEVLPQILTILNEDREYFRLHKYLLTQALKWKNQNKNDSILLRGFNLRNAQAWLKIAQSYPPELGPTKLHEALIADSTAQSGQLNTEVFISYSRRDADFARRLNNELQLVGKSTWFDMESIPSGSEFAEEIKQGIEACDNFLFIISPASLASTYCDFEVNFAAELGKRFITVLYRPPEKDQKIPEKLAKIQWIDFEYKKADFSVAFGELVRTLNTDREYIKKYTKWAQEALDWKKHDKSEDYLLSQSELTLAEDWLKGAEEGKKQPQPTALQKNLIKASRKRLESANRSERRRLVIFRVLFALVIIGSVVSIIFFQRAVQRRDVIIRQQQEYKNLQARTDSAKTALSSTQIELLQSEKESDSLRRARERLRNELETNQQLSAAQKQRLQDSINAQSRALADRISQQEQLKNELSDRKAELDKVQAQANSLAADLEKTKKDLAAQTSTAEQLRKDKETLQTKVNDLNKQISELKSQTQTERQKSEAQINELKSTVSGLQSERSSLQQTLSSTRAELRSLRDSLKAPVTPSGGGTTDTVSP